MKSLSYVRIYFNSNLIQLDYEHYIQSSNDVMFDWL